MPDIERLRLTAAHHGDNEFHELGDLDHEVPLEQLFATLKAQAEEFDCDTHDICYIVDCFTSEGIVDDVEVSAERAAALLGRDLHEAIQQARRDLAGIYESFGSTERAEELRTLASA